MRLGIALVILVLSASAVADGYEFREGRFPEGQITVFRLTPMQKKLIEVYRRCRDNTKTPYIFRLTDKQRAVLAKEAGIGPRRFAIFESYRGDPGVDIEYNVINRFNESNFEIPHKLLLAEHKVRNWEKNIIGWAPNPVAKVNPARMKSRECPK